MLLAPSAHRHYEYDSLSAKSSPALRNQIPTPAEFNHLRSSANPSEARPSRAKRGRRRKAPGSRRRPPSLARASNKSTDASLLAATELVASKHLSSAGKRALHERDFGLILHAIFSDTNMSSCACIVLLFEASSSRHVILQHCASAQTPGLRGVQFPLSNGL